MFFFFFFQAEDGIRDYKVTGVQTCALPISAKGFSGTVDDALVLDVIGAYRKQLQKALAEFEKVGERGAAHVAQLRFELEFCERYLPKGMDESALRTLVRERLDALKIADAKQVGRLVGDVLKA